MRCRRGTRRPPRTGEPTTNNEMPSRDDGAPRTESTSNNEMPSRITRPRPQQVWWSRCLRRRRSRRQSAGIRMRRPTSTKREGPEHDSANRSSRLKFARSPHRSGDHAERDHAPGTSLTYSSAPCTERKGEASHSATVGVLYIGDDQRFLHIHNRRRRAYEVQCFPPMRRPLPRRSAYRHRDHDAKAFLLPLDVRERLQVVARPISTRTCGRKGSSAAPPGVRGIREKEP